MSDMKKLLFCTQKVNRKHIRRESRNGVEHIILTSFTLPANIVMNGGLYSKEERDKSFKTLNRTPATLEHPEIDGVFVSANDPETDFDFRFGAFNENARITDDDRIALDKVINVQKALKTEKGKRLLDRIDELENNENARPIHTSVGVFLDVEEVEPTTNEHGQEFTWIAKDMIFDHDAILIDSVGASTPDQGTGIGVNKENVNVEHFILNSEDEELKDIPEKFHSKSKTLHSNQKVTFAKIFNEIQRQINLDKKEGEFNWLLHESVDEDSFVFETQSGELFKSNYIVDEKANISIQDTRLPVERVVEFRPINPADNEEDNAMRDKIIAELGKLGIKVNADISEADLMAEYTKALIANNTGDDGDGAETDKDKDVDGIADIVLNAVSKAMEPALTKISDLEKQINSNSNKELDDLATFIVSSKKYPELDVDNIKSLGLDKAKAMAANCGTSYGIPSTMQINNKESDMLVTNVEDLPE